MVDLFLFLRWVASSLENPLAWVSIGLLTMAFPAAAVVLWPRRAASKSSTAGSALPRRGHGGLGMGEAPGLWNDPRKLDLIVAFWILGTLPVVWFVSQLMVVTFGYGVIEGLGAGVVSYLLVFSPAIYLALRRRRLLLAARAETR